MLSSGRVFIGMVLLGAAWLSQAAAAREFRISHQWSADIDARDRAARVFVAEVQKRLPGITFSIHPRSSLGIKPAEQFDAMTDGRAELAIYPLFYASKKVPEFSIGLLPGVPANTELALLLKGSEFEEKVQALAMEKGVRILTWWWLGGGIASRTQEIGGPETVREMSIRTGDKAFDLMMQAAGGDTPSMASTEIAKKMGSGELDSALTSYESFVSFRIYEHAKHATLGGFGIWTSFQPLIMSRAAWESLSPKEQQAFEEAAEISDAYFEGTQRDALQMAVEAFTKAGANVKELTFEEYAAWLNVAKVSSWEEYQKISPVAASLFTSMLRSFIDSDKRAKVKLAPEVQRLQPKPAAVLPKPAAVLPKPAAVLPKPAAAQPTPAATQPKSAATPPKAVPQPKPAVK
ncbi:MAG: TRAP transporter substrate-binding protein DctP [Hyphomicrobiaceae bacterium]|nr:TRAP transporter substrate-binding protein DctP [Hyphomicrobiaceae bacterium]